MGYWYKITAAFDISMDTPQQVIDLVDMGPVVAARTSDGHWHAVLVNHETKDPSVAMELFRAVAPYVEHAYEPLAIGLIAGEGTNDVVAVVINQRAVRLVRVDVTAADAGVYLAGRGVGSVGNIRQ